MGVSCLLKKAVKSISEFLQMKSWLYTRWYPFCSLLFYSNSQWPSMWWSLKTSGKLMTFIMVSVKIFFTPLFTCSLKCLEFSGVSVPSVTALCFHLAVSWADGCGSSYDEYFYSDPPLLPSKVVLHHSRSF